MDFITVVPYLLVVIGAIGRVVVPYVLRMLETEGPLQFDWRYVIGQVIGVLGALVPLFIEPGFVEGLTDMGYLALILLGWASGDIGRHVQKAYENYKK